MRPDRIEKERHVVVDILSCDKDTSLDHAQLAGKTIDVSAAGMKVTMYVPVPEHARVALHVDGETRQFNL
ncbi:MAG TPA: hypothetical protein VJ998_09120, partial [Pseudomonadales bacterium]|nr:hypothetical protein [Pseudomonadales bacterium]